MDVDNDIADICAAYSDGILTLTELLEGELTEALHAMLGDPALLEKLRTDAVNLDVNDIAALRALCVEHTDVHVVGLAKALNCVRVQDEAVERDADALLKLLVDWGKIPRERLQELVRDAMVHGPDGRVFRYLCGTRDLVTFEHLVGAQPEFFPVLLAGVSQEVVERVRDSGICGDAELVRRAELDCFHFWRFLRLRMFNAAWESYRLESPVGYLADMMRTQALDATDNELAREFAAYIWQRYDMQGTDDDYEDFQVYSAVTNDLEVVADACDGQDPEDYASAARVVLGVDELCQLANRLDLRPVLFNDDLLEQALSNNMTQFAENALSLRVRDHPGLETLVRRVLPVLVDQVVNDRCPIPCSTPLRSLRVLAKYAQALPEDVMLQALGALEGNKLAEVTAALYPALPVDHPNLPPLVQAVLAQPMDTSDKYEKDVFLATDEAQEDLA